VALPGKSMVVYNVEKCVEWFNSLGGEVMARFTDYYTDGEVKDIMERFIERFPKMFEGFDVDGIGFIVTKKKKSAKPIRLLTVSYPMDAFLQKPYIVEVFESVWRPMTPKQKNLAVFHIMCAIPQEGFDESSKYFSKKVKPEITMYMREFAASGGVPNWMENPSAVDPMENTEDNIAQKLESNVELDDGGEGCRVSEDKVVSSAGPKLVKAKKMVAAA
jgi:hypothetical protein